MSASLTQKATSGIAWSALFQISRQLLSLASVSVLARYIFPADYGVVAMAAVLTNFLDTFRDLGTGNALVREPKLTDELVSSVFWLTCALGLLVAAAVIAVSGPVSKFFHEPEVAPVLRVLSAVFFFNALAVVPVAILNREMLFRRINLAALAGTVVGTAVAIVIAIRGGRVWSLVFGNLTNTMVWAIAVWIPVPCRIQRVLRWDEVRRIWSYSVQLSGYNVVNYFSRNADNLIVGRFLGDIALGYYQMAYTLMMYPLTYFSSVISQVLLPAVSRVQENNEQLRKVYVRTCALIGLFTIPAMLGLAVLAQPFVRVFLGDRWLPVAGVLSIFGPLGMVQSISTTVSLIYNAKGRADWLFRWGAISSILFIVSFLLGLRWGFMGVAVCYTIAFALLLLPSLLIPFRLIGLSLSELCKHLWPSLKAGIIMAAAVLLWIHGLRWIGWHSALVELSTGATLGAAMYISLMFWWKALVLRELKTLLEQSGMPAAARFAGFLPGTSAA